MKHDVNSTTTALLGSTNNSFIPHQGSLCRIIEDDQQHFVPSYVIHIEILSEKCGGELKGNNNINSSSIGRGQSGGYERITNHELVFNRYDYEFASRVFAILDSESTSLVDRDTVHEFVYRRCPVFWRRDEDLTKIGLNYSKNSSSAKLGRTLKGTSSLTFDEIWDSVVSCSRNAKKTNARRDVNYIGVEGWMVFFRFIALAQYLEAKRRFSARHLQQTMRHRNSPRGSEMVVVDVPPAEPPVPLTPWQLAQYEQNNKTALPAPELDLDHSLLAAHDCKVNIFRGKHFQNGQVKISLFGSSNSSFSTQGVNGLEFAVTYCRGPSDTSTEGDEIVVRRSMSDMKWLDETFSSHKVLGGTLCGRILPPFPGTSSVTNKVLSSHFHSGDDSASSILPSTNSIKKTTGSAINVAAAGVGRIRDVAKSFMGGYLMTSTTGSKTTEDRTVSTTLMTAQKSSSMNQKHTKKKSMSLSLPENYYNPNSPTCKARQLERYLNYLLEHPALSTSFPLNTILKASQSGVDAAKQCLDECSRVSKELKDRTPQLVDGKVGIPFWPHGSTFSPNSTNFAWVRTAAQAAIALKVHGMLETSGLPTASARLQHASLPSFGNASTRTNSGWEDIEIEAGARIAAANAASDAIGPGSNFEEGVVNDDGFDLLPLPVPAPERRILSAGSNTDTQYMVNGRHREERFHYGSPTVQGRYAMDDEDEIGSAFLGDVAVDENIDKLREVIGSVDNTLSRCLASSGGIGKAQRERLALHLNVVGGLDSWAGMRGKFVSQRSLLKGIAGIEQSKAISEESDLALIDDLSWQTSLASAAVAASEDVRAAVRASRTAANARATASSAALSAQQACEKGDFASMDEARAAQTRASIAQSHAIHAAVVEHESKTVKRRATLALAHDVKTWNIHRKREMLRSCVEYAKSQLEASRRSVDSWSSLRDGFIGATMAPATIDRRHATPAPAPIRSERRRSPRIDPDEVTATIFDNFNEVEHNHCGIVAVDHNVLSSAVTDFTTEEGRSVELQQPETFLPFAAASPIPEEVEQEPFAFADVSPAFPTDDFAWAANDAASTSRHSEVVYSTPVFSTPQSSDVTVMNNSIDFNLNMQLNLFEPECAIGEHEKNSPSLMNNSSYSDRVDFAINDSSDSHNVGETTNNVDDDVVGDLIDFRRGFSYKSETPVGSTTAEDVMSESMQSLVDGLMSWGGGFEAEEEHFALPAGMATSIALENSGAMGPSLI